MTREILFRGKSLESGEWVFGFYFQDEEGHKIKTWVNDPGNYIDEPPEDYEADIPVDGDTVGQYIGREYKNDDKMFEGDYVEVDLSSGRPGGTLVRDVLSFSKICFISTLEHVGRPHIKLLGNIHDNKGLLND